MFTSDNDREKPNEPDQYTNPNPNPTSLAHLHIHDIFKNKSVARWGPEKYNEAAALDAILAQMEHPNDETARI